MSGTPRAWNARRREYALQYGVSDRVVEIIGVAQLDRMAEHARATMFSTLKWDKEHRGWRFKGSVAKRVPGLYRERLARECEEAKLRGEQKRREARQLEILQPTDRRHFEWLQSLVVKRRDVERAGRAVRAYSAPDPHGEQLMELVSKIKRRVA